MLWHKVQGAGGTVGGGGGGVIEFIDYLGFDADSDGETTVTFPAGTQDGDLVILLAVQDARHTYPTPPSPFTEIWSCDNGDGASGVHSQMSYGFYNSATWPSSVVIIGNNDIDNSGVGVAVYRNVSTITSQTSNGQLQATSAGPTVSFNSSTLSSDGRVLCAVAIDDDIPSAASQTGYTADAVDFVGIGAGNGCGIVLTLSDSTISSGSYTPPNVSITGVSGETITSMYLLLT
jgi:hypothetical protein